MLVGAFVTLNGNLLTTRFIKKNIDVELLSLLYKKQFLLQLKNSESFIFLFFYYKRKTSYRPVTTNLRHINDVT